MPPTGASISATSRPTARATSSSISTRCGLARRSTRSASTTTCRCRTGATATSPPAIPDGFETASDPADLRPMIAAGEGFDWYYAQRRRPRRPPPHADHRRARRQALGLSLQGPRGWWPNAHHDRLGGSEAAAPTAWVPGSKPFWFTEIGCPAVDKGANQPERLSRSEILRRRHALISRPARATT